MITRITIDELTEKSVSIRTQNYLEDSGIEYPVGLPSRCSFINTVRGRAEIVKALSEPYFSAVIAIWGETATVEEPEPSI